VNKKLRDQIVKSVYEIVRLIEEDKIISSVRSYSSARNQICVYCGRYNCKLHPDIPYVSYESFHR